METNKIYLGDSLAMLRMFPDECVNICVTSPPYWALRDYGIAGQMGSEATPEEYITKMVEVFREVRRVLRKDGTCWVNMGDSYASGANGRGDGDFTGDHGRTAQKHSGKREARKLPAGMKLKDLCGIPWMLAFALRADGWYLRQDIIWAKPNPMPESVKDRCTKSHEYIFLLSRSKHYYYDAYAIAEPYADKTFTTFGCSSSGYGDGTGMVKSENIDRDIPIRKPKDWKMPDNWDTKLGAHGNHHREGREKGKRKMSDADKSIGGTGTKLHGHSGNFDAEGNLIGNGRANKRSVWTVSTQSFTDAHFATFPEKLIEPCILAGCPVEGIVLDPFMGAGTTALVALKLNRKYIGIELNPKYIKIAARRIRDEMPLFN
jgi:site-specific DNA-methyltransferase (adenine-specific)